MLRCPSSGWSFIQRATGRSVIAVVLTALALIAIWQLRLRADAVEDLTPMPTPDEDAAAARLLHQVADAYKRAETYEDYGSVNSEFTGDHPFSTTTTFKTAFVRPNKFRFEFAESFGCTPTHEIIWTDSGPESTKVDSSLDPERNAGDSLSREIARATGVSSGSAHQVPRLLMPDILSGWNLTEPESARIVGDETVDGESCTQVHLRGRGGPSDVWINKRTFLIEKIVRRSSVAVSTTTYRPVVNGAVQPSELTFKQ
jgi:hypothetical protein